MSVTGIIVEYNPFHNGHLYHIEKTRETTGCSSVFAVMSGNFVQRGEPALVNKWVRTEMALRAGIDLVLELPVLYSTSSAEGFAFGAVSTLNSLGIVDNICFGSESGDMNALKAFADLLSEEPEEYRVKLAKYLKQGISFPAARQKALEEYAAESKCLGLSSQVLDNIMSSSNNILAIEYLKALRRLSSKIKPFTIRRISNSYNEPSLTGAISSATAIRKNINSREIKESMPQYSYNLLLKEFEQGRKPLSLNDFSDIVLYKLREMDITDISKLMDVGEGLEYKIKRGAEDSNNIDELIGYIKNKRFTSTRIQRILIYSLLGITKDLTNKIKSPVEYVRVLGFNENGRRLLRNIKKNIDVPLITNPSAEDTELLHYDMKATDIFVLGYSKPGNKTARQDLKVPPVMI